MIQTLVSVPPQLDAWLSSQKRQLPSPFNAFAHYVGSDPAGVRLGSGGGTVSLLHRAWKDSLGSSENIRTWIEHDQRLVLHAGGESRRLPAYASIGKALLPVPFAVDGAPTRVDQVLSNFQVPAYQQVLNEAGNGAALLVASGDVWLDFNPLTLPPTKSDVAGIGMRVAPEVAQHFGVFFVAKSAGSTGGSSATREHRISFFLQKPSPAEIYRHAAKYDFYVDTGLWLFSPAAVEFLFRRCGWDSTRQQFTSKENRPEYLDLYTEIGAALGEDTRAPASLQRHGWAKLTRSVIPLEDAQFFHMGSSRQLLESYEALSSSKLGRQKVFSFATASHLELKSANLPVWVDGAGESKTWLLDGMNVVTGSAPGMPTLHLAPEQCLEIAPVAVDRFVVRPYLLDDRLRGAANKDGTICSQPAATWLRNRGLEPSSADVFQLPIYPILPAAEITQAVVDWFFTEDPAPSISDKIRQATRLSAADIPNRINFDRYFAARDVGHTATLLAQFDACVRTGDARVFDQDFSIVAHYAATAPTLKTWLRKNGPSLASHLIRPEHRSRLLMLLAELARGKARDAFTHQAHAELVQGVITSDQFPKCQPRLALKEDQIVWGRSPVRLDLAGGWTDTPPFCFEHGGSVLNIAVLLNGQPPIQVFVRPLTSPVIQLRSIDLGAGEDIKTYQDLETFRDPRSGFSLPKAALAMAGFLPAFASGRPAISLKARLERFGGGLEISLLSAVPKGSGLGTSSILAATILGALNRACQLDWDEVSLYNRVLGVEQLLTTGGGWQDQAGALFRGLKLVETTPGSAQTPSVRYLPEHLLGSGHANRTLLLYYTGITRLAKGILKEIVHDMFLARFETLQTLALIRANAQSLFNAIQRNDTSELMRCVARSWGLNKRLDAGTTTPEIESILAACGPDLLAAKLLGAGGGGYMLICAATPDAGDRIREKLERQPPNRRARFIDFQIAATGLHVTVS